MVHYCDQALQKFLFGVVVLDSVAAEDGLFASSLFLVMLDKDLQQLLLRPPMTRKQTRDILTVVVAYYPLLERGLEAS